MARSLNSQEAQVFSQDVLPAQKSPPVDAAAEALFKHIKTLDPALDPGLWICGHFFGVRES